MSDAIRIKCPSCATILKAPGSVRGKRVECSACGTPFRVSAPKVERAVPDALPTPPPRPKPPPRVTAPDVVVLSANDVELVDKLDVPRPNRVPAKPKDRTQEVVVEDFQIVDDLDSFSGNGEDSGDPETADSTGYHDEFLDLPDGYEDGPTLNRPRKKDRRINRPGGYTSIRDDQRARHNNQYNSRSQGNSAGQDWDGTVIGASLSIIGGVALCALGTFGFGHRGAIKALVLGGMMLIGGLGTLAKRLLD